MGPCRARPTDFMNHGEHGGDGVESEIDQVNKVNEVPEVRAVCPFALPVGGEEAYLIGPAGQVYAAFDTPEHAEYAARALNAYAAAEGQR